MLNKIKDIFTRDEEKEKDYRDFFTLYFYSPANSCLSVKKHKQWNWFATIPEQWIKKGIPVVRTHVKLDRREFNCRTSINSYVITLDNPKVQQHLVNNAIKVKGR